MAEQLRQKRLAFLDLAGNAWIQTPEFLIWVHGEKPTQRRTAIVAPRAFQTKGLQLLFALLTNPEWIALTTRELADKVGIANGTVAAALRDLEGQGFIVRANKRDAARRLRNRRVLLDKWTEGYLQRFQPTTLLDRYRHEGPDTDWWKTIEPQKTSCVDRWRARCRDADPISHAGNHHCLRRRTSRAAHRGSKAAKRSKRKCVDEETILEVRHGRLEVHAARAPRADLCRPDRNG